MSPNTTHNTAARLRELRESKGLSQAMLAGRAGLQQSAVSQFEHGLRPGKAALVRLALALGVTEDVITGGAA